MGASAPWHFSLGNFCWPTEKKEGPGRTGKWRGKKENLKGKKENLEGKMWKLKREGKKYENEADNLFSFFFSFACHFLKTTKFCLGCTKFLAGKKLGKVTLTLWKIFLLCHWNFPIENYDAFLETVKSLILRRE